MKPQGCNKRGAKETRGDSEPHRNLRAKRRPEISEARALLIAESYLGDCESLARRSLSVEQVKKAILKNTGRPGYLRAIPSNILASHSGEPQRKGGDDGN